MSGIGTADTDQREHPADDSIIPHPLYNVQARPQVAHRKNMARNASTLSFPMFNDVVLKPTQCANRWRRHPTVPPPSANQFDHRQRPNTLNSTQITYTFPKLSQTTPTPVYINTPPSLNLVPCQVFLYIPQSMDTPVLVPNIDELIPLPANAAEALPELSREQEIEMRARTIKLISDLTGIPIVPTQENKDEAEELARQMIDDPKKRIEYSKYPNETMAWLAGMIQQSNCSLVDDLAEYKNYVINKLVAEIETTSDSKLRIQALTKLGEVDGVDAFKKRSEVTHVIKPIEEIEKELIQAINVLENVEYRVIEDKNAANNG